MNERRHITVEGVVQGVGFRPFVYGLALKNRLAGFVLNDTAGVTIELEGEPLALENFLNGTSEGVQAPGEELDAFKVRRLRLRAFLKQVASQRWRLLQP